ncbi:DUF4347 domain-containing protein, partial [Marinobacter sp. F4216]|uniref:DUF4347 domain-containing protein n=1 Tax=Marinobacter sp. F4216 TaxID=2874281 RepID=UPI001CBA72C5
MDKKQKKRGAPLIEALEPRMLFSADMFAGAADNPATDDSLATLLDDTAAVLEKQRAQLAKEQTQSEPSELSPQDQEVTSPATETSVRTELVFVDTDTPDYQQLVDGMLSESDDDRRLEVILLDNNRDGIEQITATLQDYQAVDAIHIISHGSDGAVDLGSGQLSNENLLSYQGQLQSWAEYLDSDADILFYGCDLAASESGKGLINEISELTQADVAASDDLTGHQSLGGDWDLEYQAGDIEATVAISDSQQSQWQNILPTLNGANDLQTIDEDPVSNNGTLVTDLIAGQITHPPGPGGGVDGIAVIAVDDSNGTWEYTTDGGTNWIAFGAVDSSAARLLAADANTSVRFVPDADWNGTVTDGITFQAWDQTSGTAGGTMDLSTTFVLDSFENGYSGNNGSVNWSDSWQTTGANISISSAGSVVDGSYLQIGLNNGTSIEREVDLSGATSATLSFTYEESYNVETGTVILEIFDGANWNPLQTYYINQDNYVGNVGSFESFDISAYAAANTTIRFKVDAPATGALMYIDDVRIDFTTSGTAGSSAFSAESASSSVTVNPVNDAPIDLTTTSNTQGGISLNEDGGNDTYLVADSGLPSPLSQFTVEVQFEGKNTSPDHETAFISYNTGSGDVLSIQTVSSTDTNNPNALELDIGTGTPVYSDAIDYNAALMDGQSHTLSVSWDNTAGDWSIYIDGVLVDSGTGLSAGETIPTGGTLMFGQEQDGAGGSGSLDPLQHFNGTLYDVRLFDDVRTATEVATHYSETLPSNEPGLVANWIFDNLSDSGGVIDSVGGNNLTVGHASGAGFTPSNPELILSVLDTDVNGTVVGTLSTIDPDIGDSFTYTLLDNAGGRFDIDPVSGEITVLDASLIDYQTATSHAITVQVTDSGGLTYSEIFTIEVVDDTNAAPTGSALEDTALSYTENDGAVAITSTLAITDADDTNIQSAVVQITAGYISGEDVLGFTDQNGITGSFDAATGTLTLTGSATLGQYETALRSITYNNTSENPDTTTRTVSFTVNDGNANSNTQARDIAITSVNDAPTVGTNAAATVAEGGQVTITSAMLSGADPDDAGAELTYTVTSGPTNGQLELTTNPGVAISSFTQDDIDNNRLIFVHDGSQVTTDAFGFSLADGGEDGAASATDTFNFNVTNVNDAPTAANNTITTNEDTVYTFTAADFKFSDIDGDALASVQITSLESAGSLQLNGVDVTLNQVITKADIDAGNLTFTPVADANGTGYDSFGFSVNDGTADSASSYTMTVDVMAQNDAPTTSPVTLAPIAEDSGARTITQAELLGNASDADGDSLTATGLAITSGNGLLTDNGDGTWTYTPAPNDDTSVSFSYSITDGSATVAGSATLDITPVNDAPVNTVPGAQTVNEDTSLAISGISVTDADNNLSTVQLTVNNGTVNVTLSGAATISAGANDSGDLTLSGSVADINATLASLTYQGNLDVNGSDTLTVLSTDSNGASDSDTVAITVTPINDTAVFSGDTSGSGDEDTVISGS